MSEKGDQIQRLYKANKFDLHNCRTPIIKVAFCYGWRSNQISRKKQKEKKKTDSGRASIKNEFSRPGKMSDESLSLFSLSLSSLLPIYFPAIVTAGKYRDEHKRGRM